MVILRSQNKITDFLMILAWASPFNMRNIWKSRPDTRETIIGVVLCALRWCRVKDVKLKHHTVDLVIFACYVFFRIREFHFSLVALL